jgi:hypothetical protein
MRRKGGNKNETEVLMYTSRCLGFKEDKKQEGRKKGKTLFTGIIPNGKRTKKEKKKKPTD